MPKKAGMEKWKKMRRIEYLQEKKNRYYIFCEGERTEPDYFKGFKKLIEKHPVYKNMVLIEIEPCGAETLRVIKAAENYVASHGIEKGEVWCVYDKDSFPEKSFNDVIHRAELLNKKNEELRFRCAWSNQCIEYWFILHFSFYHSDNSRSGYITYLNKEFQKAGFSGYKKTCRTFSMCCSTTVIHKEPYAMQKR